VSTGLDSRNDGAARAAIVAGAEPSLERAHAEGWTVVGTKNDWATVFADGA
jgi:hypothetical protein